MMLKDWLKFFGGCYNAISGISGLILIFAVGQYWILGGIILILQGGAIHTVFYYFAKSLLEKETQTEYLRRIAFPGQAEIKRSIPR